MRGQYRIFADYHQFYLWDQLHGSNTLIDFTEEDCLRRVAVAAHVIAIQPDRNMTVPVEIGLLDRPSAEPFDAWDHVVEASLAVPSGILECHECTGGSIDRWRVTPGFYRVRACFGGLGTIDAFGIEGGDHYRVDVWPAPLASVVLLKDYGPRRVWIEAGDHPL